MQRRHLLSLLAGAAVMPVGATAPPPSERLGIAWRGPNAGDTHHVGVLAVDWAERRMDIGGAAELPSRPHGLLPEAGGGLLAVAARPGRWLLRLHADGHVAGRLDIDDERLPRRFGGHVVASMDGQRLYTTETDTDTGAGRIGVRDARTLKKLDDWSTAGIEPHQLLVDPLGHLVVANGGIRRDADDRKRDLGRMDASLVRLDRASGRLQGQWRLRDARLSLRHLAWSDGLLGIALQAEHDRKEDRMLAPALAVWDGQTLRTVAGGDGYAGDIAGVPRVHGGGFVISHAARDIAWWWQPAMPEGLTPVAKLQRAYALASGTSDGAVLIAAGRGLARWLPRGSGAMLPWPQAMAIDNHMVMLAPRGDPAASHRHS